MSFAKAFFSVYITHSSLNYIGFALLLIVPIIIGVLGIFKKNHANISKDKKIWGRNANIHVIALSRVGIQCKRIFNFILTIHFKNTHTRTHTHTHTHTYTHTHIYIYIRSISSLIHTWFYIIVIFCMHIVCIFFVCIKLRIDFFGKVFCSKLISLILRK